MMPSERSMEMAKKVLKEMADEGFTWYEAASVGKWIEDSVLERKCEYLNVILNSLSILLPQMTASEKNELIAFGEGMALVHDNLRSTMKRI